MTGLSADKDGGLLLRIHVQPRSSKNRISGFHGDAVKVCVTAPPVDGEANRALTAFLAGVFHLPKAAVELKSGESSRTKVFRLHGLSATAAEEALRAHL